MNEIKYYPITRYRQILTQNYISEAVKNGACGFNTYEEADRTLEWMDTDDSDYEVCICIDGKWFATRDGKTICNRKIP